MNQPKSPNSQLLQFMLRAQQLARQDVKTDKGYAMMMTSIITIMLFSLMGAFLTMTNLAKSSTDAYIDGNNTFYAAESGLNKRAEEFRTTFDNYSIPSDGGTTETQKNETEATAISNLKFPRKPTLMSSCYDDRLAPRQLPELPSDFECKRTTFTYHNNIARTAGTSADTTVLSEADGVSISKVEYTAYTFISDKTNYDNASIRAPIPTVIASGTYEGLNAQEYKYTVNATATKPNANVTGSQIGQSGDNKSVLQMDFKSRTIPLFQFGAFYTRNLELNPSPQMTFNGRLHSNQNVYLSGGNGTTLSLNGVISAVTSINTGNPSLPDGYRAGGTVQIQKDPADATSLAPLPANSDPTATAVPVLAKTFTEGEVATVNSTYNRKLKIALTALTPPPIGFLTKADASKADRIGEYYGKADLRLEMFPDRSVPFKLQVVKSGGTTASTTCAAAPFSTTVSKERAEYNKAECTDLSESQLRSLMQPVLVRPKSDDEFDKFCTASPVTAPTLSAAATPAVKERILDALYFTLVAQTAPVRYSSLNTKINAFSSTSYQFEPPTTIPVPTQFNELLTKINSYLAPSDRLTTTDIDNLKDATPAQIAALSSPSTTTPQNITTSKQRSCFIPAPIQALFNPTSFNSTTLPLDTATNFFDRRENRYIRMLQTNIQSLTLWNRDGLFVSSFSSTDDANALAIKFGNMTPGNSSANNLLFAKAPSVTTALVYDSGVDKNYKMSPLPNSFRTMGLAASDRTEGGLVIHATIAVDKTTTYPYTYTPNTTYPYLTNPTTPTTLPTEPEKVKQSPYGFAFNDGANLPAPLTIATDQAVYTQGDWNNIDKQPASFLADTIAVLSNSCLNRTADVTTATSDLPASLMGQLNCGRIAGVPNAATLTTINAAFLSRTDDSTATYYSGGLNNYMRILENWTGQAMNYTGSFISLGAPLEVSGRYRACLIAAGAAANNYACPPIRNWQYDTSFNGYTGLPPLPPKVTELQQDSFRRKYN